jgi:2,3-bisphosphoglycerate-independent phosphoglycerate mutase
MPKTALKDLHRLNQGLSQSDQVEIGMISGRYYAMDRDQRWDRTKHAYDALVYADGPAFADPEKLIADHYADEITDEFIAPHVADSYIGVETGDALIACNFRADRMRQILRALTKHSFVDFDRGAMAPPNWVHKIGMVEYADDLADEMAVLFPPVQPDQTLGQVVAEHGLTQLRLAESEKYPHVTYFLNGGREDAFDGEQRIIVPSPDVATYDERPEMSAHQVANECIAFIDDHRPDLIVLNFANPDMVGHTGDLSAAITAVETVDHCLGRVITALQDHAGQALIVADHGNAETMINPDTGQPHSAHTTNPVPCIYIGDRFDNITHGGLADVAPTILSMMNINAPNQMIGTSLLS